MKKMKIAVLGTQASGKGTQSFILSVLMGVPAVSVGDLLRDLQNEDSARGREAKFEMAKGSFVPDTIILPLVREWTSRHPAGWIVDGFPRSLEQAKACEAFFRPDAVLYLEVPDQESQRRISYRRICSKCKTNYNLITQPPRNSRGVCDVCGGALIQRADDTPDLVTARLGHYHQVTEPLKAWFARRGKLVLVDAVGAMPDVAREVQRRLEERMHARERSRRRLGLLIIAMTALIVFVAGITLTGYVLNS